MIDRIIIQSDSSSMILTFFTAGLLLDYGWDGLWFLSSFSAERNLLKKSDAFEAKTLLLFCYLFS